jgi:hypothetical protein
MDGSGENGALTPVGKHASPFAEPGDRHGRPPKSLCSTWNRKAGICLEIAALLSNAVCHLVCVAISNPSTNANRVARARPSQDILYTGAYPPDSPGQGAHASMQQTLRPATHGGLRSRAAVFK